MASHLQNSLWNDLWNGNLIEGTHTFRMTLHTSTYTPNKDHATGSDLSNEVANGNGYTTGGETVTVTVTTDNANDRASISFSTPSWNSASFTARYGVVRRDVNGDGTTSFSTDPLIATLDFGADRTASNGTFSTSETSPFYINT